MLILASCSRSKYPTYHMLDVYDNADINHAMIDSIDNMPGGYGRINTVFYPQAGNYTVIRFLATDYGTIFTDYYGFRHYLVLIKVDDRSNIVESYLYFLEDAEMPFSMGLLKSAKHIPLKNDMTIKSLGFEMPENGFGIEYESEFLKKLKSDGHIVIPEAQWSEMMKSRD